MTIAYASSAGASLASGGGTSLTLSKPTGTVEGNLLLVSIVISANVTITPPSDAVAWNTTVNAAGVKGYWKVAGASEPSSYTFTRSADTNTIVGTIARVTGAHASAPIDTAAAQAGGSDPSVVIPSLTAGTGTFLIQIASSLTTCTFTPPASAVEVADAQHATASLTSAIGHEPISAGATGTRTWTASVSGTRSGIMWSVIPANGINRAGTLYLRNSATLDTGTGIDVRLLHTASGGVNDDTSAVQFTNANDGVERTYDPATGAVTNTNNAATTLFKMGWGLRLVDDMTPPDDTNCDAVLPAGTVTFTADAVPTITGTLPVAGTIGPSFKASLWRYNPSSDTGTLIIGGTQSPVVTWACNTTNNDTGVVKSITLSLVVPSLVTFAAGEILMLQVGLNTNTVPNPLTGTMTVSMALRVGTNNTNLAFAGSQNIMQSCALTSSPVGEGLATRVLDGAMARDTVGEGLSSRVLAGAMSRDSVGEGLSSRGALALAEFRDITGEGVTSRVLALATSHNPVGEGLVSRDALGLTMARDTVGEGLVSSTKLTTAAKTFDLVGEGLVTELHPVTAARTFDLTGEGLTSMTRAVTAAKTFDVVGEGSVSRDALLIVTSQNVVGEGLVDTSKLVIAAKTFDLVGEGLVTELHPITAFRTFDLVGNGELLMTGPNGSTICLPLDELPTGVCPADWPTNDGTKEIAGNVIHHETGVPIVGADLRLFRDSDDLMVATSTSGAGGAYSFPRDSADPYTYYVTAQYLDAGVQVHGVTDRGCVPV